MSKPIYEKVLDLRNRISLDDDDIIYDEDYLLLDEVLNYIENNEQRVQEKLLELYKELTFIYEQLYTIELSELVDNKDYIKQQEKLELEYKIDYNQNQEHISFITKQYNDMREKYNNSNTEKLVLEHKQEKQEKLLKLYKQLVNENLQINLSVLEKIKEKENE